MLEMDAVENWIIPIKKRKDMNSRYANSFKLNKCISWHYKKIESILNKHFKSPISKKIL